VKSASESWPLYPRLRRSNGRDVSTSRSLRLLRFVFRNRGAKSMSPNRRSKRGNWFEWVYPTACLAFGAAVAFNPLDAMAQSAQAEQAAAQSPASNATPPGEQTDPATSAPKPVVSKPYYIEFRSRSAHSYGHTFSMHGRLANGNIATKTVTGLHPATESSVPWMIGHFVAVPSETGPSDGDTEDKYVTARFQVALSADEYRKVTGFIKDLKAKSPSWHAVLYNCNAFVGDIARFMGMETPSSTMLMPAEYINNLRDLNIAKTGLIGTPVRVASAERLRAEALKTQRSKKGGTTVATSGPKPENAAAGPNVPASSAPPAASPRTTPAPSASGASSSSAPTANAAPGSGRPKPESRSPASNKEADSKRKLTGVAPDNVDRPNLTPASN
jgi:hypothetical protein